MEKDKTTHEEKEGFKTLTLDIDYYQSFLDDADIPEDRKQELIETLWAIVVQFIDWGYGVHPVQQTEAGQARAPQSLAQLVDEFSQADAGDKKEHILEEIER